MHAVVACDVEPFDRFHTALRVAMRQMPNPGLRKCFELSAVVPLSVFVLVHVVSYGGALVGRTRFGVASPESSVFFLLEVLLVWLPLGFHALYGLSLSMKPLEQEPSDRRRALLLRLSGLVAFGFIAAHALWLRWPILSRERAPEDVAQMLVAELSATRHGVPVTALVHLLGLSAVAVHLGLGLARFAERWGLANAGWARRVAAVVSALVFVLGAATVVELATGSAVPRFLH